MSDQLPSFGRLRWLCRRGTKELDRILGGYLEQDFTDAEPGLQHAFVALLGRQDPDANDDEAYALCEQYRKRFLAEMGDTQCGRLREAIEAPGGPGTCAPLVAQAAGILMGVLDGHKS